MTSEQWRTAWRIFDTASRLPEESRRSYVEASCDPETVAEVLLMLENLRDADSDGPDDAVAEPMDGEWPRLGMTVEHYRIDGIVGRGGMGEVYSAEDIDLGRRVAMKFVGRGAVGTSGTVDRFIREARAASALNHPNVVTVHEVIRVGHSLAIVMELVEGEPLRARCGTPQSLSDVARWGRQIAEALAAAHGRTIVHRDIKPENVILRRDGYVKVLDFGLARESTGLSIGSTAGLPPGTLRYMSPEQAAGERVEGASDVFSLGVVLYELATGRHPFAARSPLAVAHNIMTQQAAAPSDANPALPPGFDSVILAMLQKDPHQRPSAAEVALKLNQPWTTAGPPKIGRKARRILLAATAIGVLMIIAIPLLLLRRSKPAENPIDAGGLQIAPFTTYEGSEIQPAFSPDGQRIAFAWTGESGHNWDIYVKGLADAQPRRLTSDPADDMLPVFSPDATRIAFLRLSAGISGPEVMVMQADGRDARSLGRIIPSFGYFGLAWWPDGKSLVVRDGNSGRASLFRLDLRTGSRDRLTLPPESEADGRPLFSPDGQRLAFLRYNATGAKVCIRPAANPADASAERCLVDAPISDIAWMPDSRRILYSGQGSLWILNASGPPKPLKVLPGNFNGLTLDSSGRRFAYVRSFSDPNIWRIGADGKDATRLIASSGEDSSPDWSRDGKRVVIRSNRTGVFELYTYAADGTSEKQITHFGAHIDNPRWSPDGRWIVFDGNRAPIDPNVKHHNIYVVPSEGGEVRCLTDDSRHFEEPSWSHDGRWIYYQKESNTNEETWKIPAEGGKPVLVDPEPMQDLAESADGRYLYYVRYNGGSGIWRRAAAGGDPEVLPGTEGVQLFRYWALAGNAIFFIAGPQDAVLRRLDLRNGHITRIADIPRRLMTGPRELAVSPDGSTILYTLEDVTASDIMLASIQSDKSGQ